MAKLDPMVRFMRKTEAQSNGCVVFTGCRNAKGYGEFFFEGRKFKAHRWVYEQTYGPLPSRSVLVMHACDNPPCVAIQHLSIGTNAMNMADAVIKGRISRGAKRPDAKLTDDAVRQIRKLLADGLTQTKIANMFGIDRKVVQRILYGRGWRHVK